MPLRWWLGSVSLMALVKSRLMTHSRSSREGRDSREDDPKGLEAQRSP